MGREHSRVARFSPLRTSRKLAEDVLHFEAGHCKTCRLGQYPGAEGIKKGKRSPDSVVTVPSEDIQESKPAGDKKRDLPQMKSSIPAWSYFASPRMIASLKYAPKPSSRQPPYPRGLGGFTSAFGIPSR